MMQTQGVFIPAARSFLTVCYWQGQTGVWIPAQAGMTGIFRQWRVAGRKES